MKIELLGTIAGVDAVMDTIGVYFDEDRERNESWEESPSTDDRNEFPIPDSHGEATNFAACAGKRCVVTITIVD